MEHTNCKSVSCFSNTIYLFSNLWFDVSRNNVQARQLIIPWSSNSRCRCFTHLDQELKRLAWLPSFSSLELLVNSNVLDTGDLEKEAVLYLPNLFPIKYIIHRSGTNFAFVCHDNNCWTSTVLTWDQKLCLTTHDFALRFFASILFFFFFLFPKHFIFFPIYCLLEAKYLFMLTHELFETILIQVTGNPAFSRYYPFLNYCR